MNILTRKSFICIVSFMFSSCDALTAPHVFGDHMVLQIGQKVPIWGRDKPGVKVTLRFAGQEKQTTASLSDGRWEIKLNPLAISTTPPELLIAGNETIKLKDILAGEVWLCSGQSNMQKPLRTWRGQPVQTINDKGTRITTLFNGMVEPLIPLALRGVLWYQGESNLLKVDGAIYTNKMIALIKSWRARWRRDFPFYYVQLPPLLYSARTNQVHVSEAEPAFREAQTKVLKLANTGMVVTTDVGDIKNMHPPRKKEVGERLALCALAKDYGRKNIEPSGPMFKGIKYQGNKAVLQFDHVDGGLVSKDGQPLTWFTAAGSDGKYFPAEATIAGKTILISCPPVPKPVNVRFAWG